MKILFVSGFLGAGKTRFIKKMSQMTGRKFVIVENEFGSLDVDGQQLQQVPQEKNPFSKVVELTEGCICCSLNISFNDSILTIANTLNPDYLVVEPSGVALTSRILEKLQKICYEQIQIIAPITIIDGEHYLSQREEYPDIFKHQILTAGSVVVSRSEQFDKADFERVYKDIKLPDDTQVFYEHYDQWTKETFDALLKLEYVNQTDSVFPTNKKRRFKLKQTDHIEMPETVATVDFPSMSIPYLIFKLNVLLSGALGKITRVKGYYPTKLNENIIFDLVDKTYYITGMPFVEDRRLVIIGKQLKKDLIMQLFEAKPYEKESEWIKEIEANSI